MKKLIIFLTGILISANAYCGTISITPFISGNDVTINHLETQRTTLQNWANGDVEGGVNIKAGSLVSQDFANSTSPITRWGEAFNDFTFSGMLPATSANLTSDISTGISYVNGYRISTNATSHTYTASKDTYVYINEGGYFIFSEVANGAAAPSTPSNSLLLAKAVTNGTAITSVSDLRTTSIQITVTTSNFPTDYRNGALVIKDSTTATHIEAGQVAIGTTLYTNTDDTGSTSTATAGNWIEGSAPNLKNLPFYVYAYNNAGSSFDLKYSSADPVHSDTSGNTAGVLRYYTTGGVYYRAMAWISGDASGLIQTQAFGNVKDSNTSNQVYFETGALATGTTILPHDDTIPQNNEGDEYMVCTFKPTSSLSKLKIHVSANGDATGAGTNSMALFQNNTANAIAGCWSPRASTDRFHLELSHYMTAGTTNPIVFRVRIGNSGAGTTTFNGVASARIFGGVSASSISVEEING